MADSGGDTGRQDKGEAQAADHRPAEPGRSSRGTEEDSEEAEGLWDATLTTLTDVGLHVAKQP